MIRTISQELELPISQKKITLVLDKAVEITKRTLATGESMKWSGFGSFVAKDISSKRLYSPSLKKVYRNRRGTESRFSGATSEEIRL